MQASIIIPSKNREALLLHALQYAVKAVENLDAEIIVVNDGEGDIPIPEAWKNKVRVLHNPKNGVASARNLGAANADSELLLFMDDDMLIHQAAVQKIIELAEQHPGDTININWVYPPELLQQLLLTKFGRYLDHYGFTTLKGWNAGQPWKEDELFENAGITSQFLAIYRKVFLAAGGYNEGFPHAGFEDYDFSKRLKKQGVHCYIWPRDTIFHNETDRHDLRKWLARKERGGETRRYAVSQGNTELALHYHGLKRLILQLLAWTESFWIAVLEALPNLKILDSLYGKLVNILLATAIFKGYTKNKN